MSGDALDGTNYIQERYVCAGLFARFDIAPGHLLALDGLAPNATVFDNSTGEARYKAYNLGKGCCVADCGSNEEGDRSQLAGGGR